MPAEEFLTKEERAQISSAIAFAERETSGEIRVHLESKCPNKDPLKRAEHIFKKLNMHKTKLRNGVLIYIATTSHKFAIFGDRGINEKVPANYWQNEKDQLLKAFRQGDFKAGIEACIADIAIKLQEFFPRAHDDHDELTNEVSID